MLSTVSEPLPLWSSYAPPQAHFRVIPTTLGLRCSLSTIVYLSGTDVMRARLICTTMSGGGGYCDGGMNTDIDAEGGWMPMGSRVRMAIAATAVGRPRHLDFNGADADESHSDSGVAWILTPTPKY
jgi:hypothetical protein